MTAIRRFSPFVLCVTLALITAGCGSSSNVPGGVVQAQTSTTPAILTGSCPVLSPASNTTNNNWLFPLGSMASDCSIGGSQGMPMPSAGVLKNLRFLGDEGNSASFAGTVTVFVNRTASALTCTASTSTATRATCSDTTHQVNVAAGDEVAVQVVMQTGEFSGPRITLEKE